MEDDFDSKMDQDRAFEPIPFESRHRRTSTATDETPSKAASTQHATFQSQAEPDTCRICRGEATPDEPLFYPCKCSGSIKYVHQDCLMEWLSHSQKKHCELCKTPFRFTKLYAPDMPKTVPFYIFISHITKYLLRNMLVWARGGLVLMVWLVWLPYLMRRVWSALFWLSDEGLGPVFGQPEAVTVTNAVTNGSAWLSDGVATCPSSQLFAQATSAPTLQEFVDGLPLASTSTTTTSVYGINITSDSPLSTALLNMFLGSFYIGGSTPRSDPTATVQGAAAPTTTHEPTLLSGFRILQKMSSSSPAFGNFAIDIMEGQIITVLVIICFILIILVRDYVVQQQPDINMRAAFAAAENAAHADDAEPAAVPPDPVAGMRAEDIENLRGPEAQDNEVDERLHNNADQRNNVWGRMEGLSAGNDGRQALALAEVTGLSESPTQEDLHHNGRAAASSANIGHVRQGSSTELDLSTVDDYVRIHRAADGDPAEIIRMIRQENLDDRLAYFVQLMQSQLPQNRPDSQIEEGESSSQMAERGSEPDRSWSADMQEEGTQPSGKGKGTVPNVPSDTAATVEQGYTSRPRSATDGPQNIGDSNPLRDGSWAWPDTALNSRLPDHRASSSIHPDSFAGALPDESGRASQARDHATPPSSTLGESASSSLQGQTPSSSENNDQPHNGPFGISEETSEAAVDTGPPEDWETLSEFNGPLDLRHDAAAQEDGAVARDEHQPDGFAQRLADFMWRDVDAIPPHELAPLPDAVDEFFDHDRDAAVALADEPLPQDEERDQEVVAAAAEAGIDPDAEAIEDAEDLEGILELLGMRGPIAGLFQNALFCAFLVSITLFLGVFLPYNVGRLAIWMVANPTRPIRILFSISKLVQDTALLLAGSATTLLFKVVDLILATLRPSAPQPEIIRNALRGSWNMTENALGSLLDSMWTDLPFISAEEVRNFSTVSHAALLTLKGQLVVCLARLGNGLLFIFGGDYTTKLAGVSSWAMASSATMCQSLKELPHLLTNPSSWVIDLATFEDVAPLKPELSSWSAMDRVWAIVSGYIAICVSAGLYLGRGGPISPGRVGQEWEAAIIDGLNQASGVMKVILIIGIEMLVFPLYCGLLLDVALLPLFEDTTIMSRVMFTLNYPFTSIFVHWFVGTGYMFHFALFVSMCRKIMRKGVLYFIRDPDDAEFHPVRDVLERNVTTQLRKILFSAFVYGALVIICLGGVVWALSYGSQRVLPIHYSSNEPVLEFPIDLLFYNFLMPLAVKFFKPSDGLHAMYTWWFRKSARALRLTWFLFGERKLDEEGTLQPAPGSPASKLPLWKRVFLEVDADRAQAQVVPKTWKGTFEGGRAKPALPINTHDLWESSARKAALVQTGQLIPDGRFVRAPASDQVKIPKGQRVFLDVTEDNGREDRTDYPGCDIYSTRQYQIVYIPPNFRFRVFLFILFIWLFAATTGLGFTIIPLIFGRWMFRMLIPDHIRTNDIYAFSIGIYVLGSTCYFVFHLQGVYSKAVAWVHRTAANMLDRDTLYRTVAVAIHTAKLTYAYSFLLIVFPIMVASLMELYILIPLDTYLHGAAVPSNAVSDTNLLGAQNNRHTVRVMQSWTIGIIYLKLAARFVVAWHRDSRLAAATRAVLRRGWLEPDVKVLTRAFVIPGLSIWAAAVFGPLMMARAYIAYGNPDADVTADNDAAVVLVYRLCFFAALLGAIGLVVLRSVVGVFRSWRVRIRDEAYLIGERLHNFSLPQAVHDSQRDRQRTRVGWD